MGKIILITGSSSGIGLASAVTLAQAGHTVVATLRGPSRADALLAAAEEGRVTLDIQPLDVTDETSVQAAVQHTLARYGQLDVLINNAGGGYLGTTETVPLSEVRRMFEVNFFGVWRVTQAVLPSMRAAGSGQILSVSSTSGVVGLPFNEVYAASKFALEGMMECLAPVAAAFGVRVSLVEPGPVGTAFRQQTGGVPALMAAGPYQGLVQRFMQAVQAASGPGDVQSADEVAQVILKTVQATTSPFRVQTSDAARTRVAQKLTDPSGDAQLAAMKGLLGAGS